MACSPPTDPGLLEQRFTKMRMALAAYPEGVLNDILLLALSAAWKEVRLSHPVKVTGYGTPLYIELRFCIWLQCIRY
jgi:hypothetical protein